MFLGLLSSSASNTGRIFKSLDETQTRTCVCVSPKHKQELSGVLKQHFFSRPADRKTLKMTKTKLCQTRRSCSIPPTKTHKSSRIAKPTGKLTTLHFLTSVSLNPGRALFLHTLCACVRSTYSSPKLLTALCTTSRALRAKTLPHNLNPVAL